MRRLVSRLHHVVATRPRIAPFLPVILRAARGHVPGPEPLPTVSAPRRWNLPAAGEVDLVVFSVIRNGITNGYPFVEAYGSWLGRADRIHVLDGESDDGTREVLDAIAAVDDSFVVDSAPWPRSTTGGSAIAQLTNVALARARTDARRLMYVQADEIYTDEQRELVVSHRDRSALEFSGCVNFWNSFEAVLENDFPMRYVRVFPADAEVESVADGYSFDVRGMPIEQSPTEYLHYGWCFPVNILRKHVSHGLIYHDDPGYRMRGFLAQLLLEQRRYDRRLLDALAPQYRPVPFRGEHPTCMQHVVTQRVYDPGRGLALLRDGARW
jgi:hypothetical protein